MKPARLVWLAPGKVKSRTWRKKQATTGPAKPHEQLDYQHPSNLDLQVSTPAVFDPSSLGGIPVPRFGLYSDAEALVQGTEYCKSPLFA